MVEDVGPGGAGTGGGVDTGPPGGKNREVAGPIEDLFAALERVNAAVADLLSAPRSAVAVRAEELGARLAEYREILLQVTRPAPVQPDVDVTGRLTKLAQQLLRARAASYGVGGHSVPKAGISVQDIQLVQLRAEDLATLRRVVEIVREEV